MRHNFVKFLMIVLMAVPFATVAQKSGANSIFERYSGKDGYTSVDINKGLFELFAEIDADDPEFDDFQKAIEGVESMRLIAYQIEEDKGNIEEKERFINDIRSNVTLDEFEELLVVKDKDANINFYAISSGSVIREVLMIVDGANEAVLLSLYGDIDLKHIAKLGSTMDLGGMEYLGKMKNN
ncbi:MAG: DUF4252 domain-containing protein [Bacteroidales bacterium]|nr:DUF4252 domain-containing protein [Bacteroidales bacterium]